MVIRLWPLTGNSAGNFVGVASAADFVAWVLGLSTSFITPGLFIGGEFPYLAQFCVIRKIDIYTYSFVYVCVVFISLLCVHE